MENFKQFYENDSLYEKFVETYYTLLESPAVSDVDKVEEFVKPNPYFLTQAVVAALIGALNHKIPEEKFYDDLADPQMGETVKERLKNTGYLRYGMELLQKGFAAAWPSAVARLENLPPGSTDQEIRNAVAADSENKLSDLDSPEFEQKIINPLVQQFSEL